MARIQILVWRDTRKVHYLSKSQTRPWTTTQSSNGSNLNSLTQPRWRLVIVEEPQKRGLLERHKAHGN